jgi:pimeloyl-ACP methyl ester carboxylesterase
LCHGWSGRGSQMGAFAAPLVKAGFTVHAFDAPAHGTSGGTQTDMIEYAETLAGLVAALGPVHALVAHSFGAANAVIARHRHRFPVNRMALLSCFASGEWVLDRFAEFLNIPAPTLARMKALHEQRHGMSFKWREMEISAMARQETAAFLFVHDRNDKEVPYAQMAGFSTAPPANFSFLSTDGLGHRRILRDPAVIREVCNFITA